MTSDRERDDADDAGRFDRAVWHWNAGRYWHAHEDWEDLWHEALDDHRLWLQGLIQYAAAFFHFDRGFYARGFERLMAQATEKVEGYAGPLHHLDWAALQRDLEPWIAYGRRVADGAPFPEAPAPIPTLHYEPGYDPAPLPWSPDPDDPYAS
ncbi:MAG: DUF309 domain-containing protein [Planctomycetota bacterium]|nr:DUF309 domain-containing protein [Planctomycetota bacterium]